jgi:hypothetical protein
MITPFRELFSMTVAISDSVHRRRLFILIGFAILLLEIFVLRAPLQASLWLDETLSIWVAVGSLAQVVDRALTYQGQSPLYFMLLHDFLGLTRNDAMVRVPSILALIAAGGVFYCIVRRWFPPDVCVLGVALLFSVDHLLVAGFSVRPYGFALLTSLGATLVLLRIVESQDSFARPLLWAALLVLTFYFHYLFVGIAVVHLVFLGCRWRMLAPETRRSCVVMAVLGAVAAIPGLEQIRSLAGRAPALSFASAPGLGQLANSIVPLELALFVGLGLAFARISGPFTLDRERFEVSWSSLIPFLVWLVGAPLFFFIHAHVTGHSMYVDRWFLWVAPASCIAVLSLVAAIDSPRARFVAIAATLGFMIVREAERVWYVEDWRGAAAIVRATSPDEPLLFFSGLVELEDPAVTTDPNKYGYLMAPLSTYCVVRSALLLSANPRDKDFEAYRARALEPAIAGASSVIFVGLEKMVPRRGGVVSVPDLWEEWLRERGFTMREVLHDSAANQVSVRRFRRG